MALLLTPYSTNIPFSYEMIESIKNQKERMLEKELAEETQSQDTKVLLGLPSIYPTEVVNAISNYFKTQKNVEKAYLMLMTKEETEEASYLLIIDFKGDHEGNPQGNCKRCRSAFKRYVSRYGSLRYGIWKECSGKNRTVLHKKAIWIVLDI